MALDPAIIILIRDEVTYSTDFVDDEADLTSNPGELGSLEAIYTNPLRGNSSVLGTALIVWRNRLAAHWERAFDVSKEGNWIARSQQTRFLRERVREYEKLTNQTKKGRNMKIVSEAESDGLVRT